MKPLPLIVLVTALALGLDGLAGGLAMAQGTGQGTDPGARKAQTKQSKKAAPKRAPTRIRVTSTLLYRLDSTPYPRTDNLGYPGPNAVRQCVSWPRPTIVRAAPC